MKHCHMTMFHMYLLMCLFSKYAWDAKWTENPQQDTITWLKNIFLLGEIYLGWPH